MHSTICSSPAFYPTPPDIWLCVTISVLFGRRIQEFALQVQIELQKKLHDMVERTRQDLLEVHFLEFTLNVNMLSHFFRKWRIYWGVYIILLCDVFDFLVSKVVILQLTTKLYYHPEFETGSNSALLCDAICSTVHINDKSYQYWEFGTRLSS